MYYVCRYMGRLFLWLMKSFRAKMYKKKKRENCETKFSQFFFANKFCSVTFINTASEIRTIRKPNNYYTNPNGGEYKLRCIRARTFSRTSVSETKILRTLLKTRKLIAKLYNENLNLRLEIIQRGEGSTRIDVVKDSRFDAKCTLSKRERCPNGW